VLIEQLTDVCIDKSPIDCRCSARTRRKRALVPLIGLETGSVRMAKQIMPSKGVPFPIDDWPSVVDPRPRDPEREQLVPGDDAHHRQSRRDRRGRKATLDLIYEVERRGLFAFFIPSIFTPLHDTRMEEGRASPKRAS
jgi:hypothetical protein